jgi:hypothetical protein
MSPLAAWSKLTMDGCMMLFSSQQVIAQRLLLLGTAGSRPRSSVAKELRRMGAEKVQAGMESAAAMAASAMAASLQLGDAVRQLATPSTTSARRAKALQSVCAVSARILDSGLKPVSRRANSNARRLRRSGGG